jgi:hypothetical protein
MPLNHDQTVAKLSTSPWEDVHVHTSIYYRFLSLSFGERPVHHFQIRGTGKATTIVQDQRFLHAVELHSWFLICLFIYYL